MLLASQLDATLSQPVSGFVPLAYMPGPFEIAILGLVVLLLFGNRLPSVMRSLGTGITEFKKGIKGEPENDSSAIEDQRRTEERAGAAPNMK